MHPGLINTSLARGWLVSTALPLPSAIRPLLAPVVRPACFVSLFHKQGHVELILSRLAMQSLP